MVRFCTALLFLLTLSSCTPEDGPTPATSDILGAWRWTSTYGGIAGTFTTPATTGVEYFLELMDNNRYAIFRNDTSAQTGTFALTLKRSIYDHEDHSFITFSPTDNGGEAGTGGPFYGVGNGIIQVNESGELTIRDNLYDGMGSVFERR